MLLKGTLEPHLITPAPRQENILDFNIKPNLINMKNLMVILFIFNICTLNVSAKLSLASNNYDSLACSSHDTIVKINVEHNAIFQGGNIEKFRDYVGKSIRYPKEAIENRISGKVIIKFVIDWDGVIKNVELLKSSGCNALDNESLRVVKKSPKWISAKDNGICVPQQFVLPLEFVSLGMMRAN